MFHLPSAEKPLQIFEFTSNVLPFVSNWMNDVFSQLFGQYVKQKKTKFMRCYLKDVDAHFLPLVI